MQPATLSLTIMIQMVIGAAAKLDKSETAPPGLR